MQQITPDVDAPIPGMSLTAELGGRPWQRPAKYSTVEETVDYYINRMSTDAFKNELFNVLEMKVPVTSIVNTIQLSSVMDGVHSVDIGVIVSPILMEFVMLLADKAGISYTTGLEEDTEEPSKIAMAKAMNEFKEKQKDIGSNDVVTEVPVVEEEPVEEEEVSTGLMARRT